MYCTCTAQVPRCMFFFQAPNCVVVVLVLTNHYTPCCNQFFAPLRHPVLKPIIWPFWARMSKERTIDSKKLKERKYFCQIWGSVLKPLLYNIWIHLKTTGEDCAHFKLWLANLPTSQKGKKDFLKLANECSALWWNDKCWQFLKRFLSGLLPTMEYL